MLRTETSEYEHSEQRHRCVMAYESPINACAAPGCSMPTSGVFCLSCATR